MHVGWLGTGLLGRPMAACLCRAGHEVAVWNRTPTRAAPLAAEGARIAASAAEAVRDAEVVFLMLEDAAAIEAVLFASETSLDLGRRTLIQMGTIAPDESRQLLERLQAEGCEYIEAPVLGSIPQAESRTLLVMVGSTPEQFTRCRILLHCFGDDIVHVGPVGRAAALKLALNQLIASLTAAFALSLGFVRRADIDVEHFMGILRKSALFAPTFDKKLSKMQSRDYSEANFPARHLLKDVRLMHLEATRMGLETSVLTEVEKILRRVVESGQAGSDYAALYGVIDPL